MRITIFTVLAASAIVSGCNRSEPATPGNALVTPGGTSRDAAVTPVATAGRAETARPVEPAPITAVWREVTIPAGTQLPVTLDTAIGSDTSRAEEPVSAHLARSISVQGEPVLEEGSRVSGVVTDATRSAKVKGRAHLGVRFTSLTAGAEQYDIRTATVTRTAQGTEQKDALKIGAPAAGGAILGAILGGKKGAAIGAGVGGGAGTAVVLSTRGEEVHLAKGARITLTLAAPLTVRVKG